MRKLIYAVAALLIAACSTRDAEERQVMDVTFAVEGDFGSPTFTRSLLADGREMTDLLIFDYMDGALLQTVHQTQADNDFGTPTVPLAFGSHRLYFVASRGSVMLTDGTIVGWEKPSDTFWASVTVSVTGGSAASRTVTLSRVSTRLRLTVLDEVPAGLASVVIQPSQWWYGMDYTTATAMYDSDEGFSINVPSSYVGTEGELVMSILGLSDADEWLTDVVITAKDGDGATIGTATIHDAPMARNRTTDYSGRLFTSANGMSVTLDDTWQASYVGSW